MSLTMEAVLGRLQTLQGKPLAEETDEAVTVATRPKPLLELPLNEEINIRAWLKHIGETDPATIAEVLNKCRDDLAARRYFLSRSEEVPQTVPNHEGITCGDCAHFKRIDHPHLDHCAKGEPEAIAGLRDTTLRFCEQFLPIGGAE